LRAPVSRALSRVATVVLDPPREGCSGAVTDGVFGGIAPRTAVYVSCNPETLARDLRRIVRHGYAVRSIQPVDMFPHTAHIETVVVLERTAALRE
jgi:23S rRNA (uracil1939-C5)-methyltransferase